MTLSRGIAGDREVPAVDRTVNLVRLLRRMAAIRPAELTSLISQCAGGSPPEVQQCLKEYGPFAGLVRLAPLFPHGYLDTSGRISASGYAHDYRRELGSLLRALNYEIPQSPSRASSSVYESRLDDVVFREVADARERVGHSSSEDLLERLFAVYDVAPRLPRLAELTERLKDDIDLSDAVMVAHQHILGTVVSQFESLWDLGLKPSRTYVVGKPYSTNRAAALYLEHQGCHVRSGLRGYATGAVLSPADYQAQNNAALGHFFVRVVKTLPKQRLSRLIVLDDGGLVLAWLNRVTESDLFSADEVHLLSKLKVVGVEQTTFGQRVVTRARAEPHSVANSSPTIPVAKVAETRLKIEKESRLIADSVVHEIDAWIRSSNERGRHVQSLSKASVGVIGYGVVGSWVCRVLHDIVPRMVVFDKDVRKSSSARAVGYQVVHSLQELAEQCSVIIGCTGAPSGVELDASMLSPGTILASASSGNYEFAPVFISGGKLARQDLNPEVAPGRPASAFDWVHSIFPVKVKGGVAFVLNGGFPVNFTGALDPIRAEEIELTRCLMVLGVASALRRVNGVSNFGGEVELAPIDEDVLGDMFD